MLKMPNLLTPIKIREKNFKNRIVMPPMATKLATTKGEVTEPLIEHYKERSKYLGMLIVEHTYVAPTGKANPNQLGIYSDRLIEGLKRLAETIKGEETVAIIQINHAGGRAVKEIIGETPIAPSKVKLPNIEEEPREMTYRDIKEIKKAFVDAAIRAIKAGFDGVEIHGAHGFLLNQFTSPITNKRLDAYGGTFEKRIRLPLEITDEIRKKIGKDKLLLYRLGADDMMPGGITIRDSIKLAKKLEDKGVDIMDVSGGLIRSRPPNLTGQGYFVPLAEKIKKTINIPVIGVGGIRDPKYADKIIREERVDFIAVGRAMLNDPRWAQKAIRELRDKTKRG